MKNKKLIGVLALTAIVANLGVATVFAQATNEGSQTVGCPTGAITLYDWDTTPSNFAFPNAYSPSAFEDAPVASTTNDTVSILSEVSADCITTPGAEDYGVAINLEAVAAGWADSGDSHALRSTLAGAEYSILSVNHSQAVRSGTAGTFTTLTRTAASTCAFTNPTTGTANASCATGGSALTNVTLIDETNATDSLRVLESASGFSGVGSLDTITYYHALPKSAAQGTYTTTLEYSIVAV